MLKVGLIAAGIALAACLGIGLWAVIDQGDGTPFVPNSASAAGTPITLNEARDVTEYDVYYLGQSFQGLRLNGVMRFDYDGAFPGNDERSKKLNRPDHRIVFVYGDCTIPAGETGCPVPLTVNVRPVDELPVEKVVGKQGPPSCVRGALVQQLENGNLELWTENAQIELVPAGDVDLEQAVSSLMRANGDKPDVLGQPFPPPKGGECN